MKDLSKYTGKKFIDGSADCYGLIREFYKNEFGIELKDYARYYGWWEEGKNLYMDNFRNEGFYLLDDTEESQYGDVFLIALGCSVASHGAIYVGENKILHHVQDRLSSIDRYMGVFRNCTLARLRHKQVAEERKKEYEFDDRVIETLTGNMRQI